MIEESNSTGAADRRVVSAVNPAKAALYAIVVAAVLLVTTVLPADYGIDLTGIGRVLGLTAMGEHKVAAAMAAVGVANAAELPPPAVASNAAAQDSYATMSELPLRIDEIEVKLAPGGEVEYKALLNEGEFMSFMWDAGEANVKFDFHGEPSKGQGNSFVSFKKGKASHSGGSLKAPFTGTHGWYWKNTTPKHVVIKLRVSGFHSDIKRL